MRAPLGLAHDELAPQELDRLAGAEDADLDQASVLLPRPAPRSSRIRRHGARLRRAQRGVNVLCAVILSRRGVTRGTAAARTDRHRTGRVLVRWRRGLLSAGVERRDHAMYSNC